MELRINKIEHHTDNTEAYCKLLNSLNIYTYVTAIDQFVEKLTDTRAEAWMKLMAGRVNYGFTVKDIRNEGMWGLEELFQEQCDEIADTI